MEDECKQSLCNEWYEFKVLRTQKKPNELLDSALANDKGFPFFGKPFSIVPVLPISTVCCERRFRQMNLAKKKI
jgi:hypothetical protein